LIAHQITDRHHINRFALQVQADYRLEHDPVARLLDGPEAQQQPNGSTLAL
jgi:hypothetical protein